MVMARLLKNRLENYTDNFNRDREAYVSNVENYNKFIDAAKAGQPHVTTDASGKQVIVSGATEDGGLMIIESEIRDIPTAADVNPEAMEIYGRDASGNVVLYSPGADGRMVGTPLPVLPNTPVQNPTPAPNLTVSNINELKNPSNDQAGLARQQAYGIHGKSQLVGDVANSRVSAFSDPEDPNDLASRGILARTLAGQLG